MRKILLSVFIVTVLPFLFSTGCSPKSEPEENKKNEQIISTNDSLDIFNGCPLEGNAQRINIKRMNLLKNRYSFPNESDFDRTILLSDLLKNGIDEERWNTHKAVEVIGYVSEVIKGGIETCNCKAKDEESRDTHIEIVADPMGSDYERPLIAEVTPRIRYIKAQQGIDWSTRTLRDRFKGRWVKVQGWLFYDNEHADEADNTAPGRERNWRKTAWEIHPITSIEVVHKPKGIQ